MGITQTFINVNGVDEIGNFYLDYGGYKDKQKTCLRPVFYVNEIKKEYYEFIPGYRTIDDVFYKCPVSVCYVQIDYLEEYIKEEYMYVSFVLRIFSKNFRKNNIVRIELSKRLFGTNPLNFTILYKIVNAINIYVEDGNNIDLLDIEVFQPMNMPKLLTTEEVFEIINKLEFKFFSNCENRVGKDNSFWSEVEISNFPKSKYLRELFMKVLSENMKYHISTKKDNFILLEYDYGFSYSSCDGREENPTSIYVMDEIKDILKIELTKNFEPVRELVEKMQIQKL